MKCEELFKEIDDINDKYLDFLEDVCNIESPTDYKEGVDAVGRYFLKKAQERGWKTEIFKQECSGDVVVITLNPDAAEKPISVSGHIDTVHPVGLFGTPAVKRDDVNMYGPGVMDCKGGVVAAFMAMEALEKVGFTARPVQLLLQSDEENTSQTSELATINYICDKAQDSVAFLNLEGIKGNTAVVQRKGILKGEFHIKGRALHSSRCAEAANAIAEAAHKIIRLEEMKNPDGLTCNCGVIKGGTVSNTVAEECSFTVDIRFVTNEELEQAKAKLEEVLNTTFVEGCTSTYEIKGLRPAMVKEERNLQLLDRMNEIYRENGLPVLTGRLCLSGSDAAFVTQREIPCIDNLGTEGGNIHSVDEYIELKSLSESAKRIAAVAYCI